MKEKLSTRPERNESLIISFPEARRKTTEKKNVNQNFPKSKLYAKQILRVTELR